MLEKLESISWDSIQRFYREGSDIPKLILELTSGDPNVYRKSLNILYQELFHQETVCEATVAAIPFLIELLEQPSVHNKREIAIFIISIILCTDIHRQFYEDILFCSVDLVASSKHISYPNCSFTVMPDYIYYYDEDESHVYDEAKKGCIVYRDLLNSDRPDIRVVAVQLLGLFPECAEQNLSWLRSHFESDETDENVLAAIVFSVSLLEQDKLLLAEWLQNVFDSSRLFYVRTNAAIVLARLNSHNVSSSIINLLVDYVYSRSNVKLLPKSQFSWYYNSSFLHGQPQYYWCCLALASIKNRPDLTLPALISVLDVVPPDESCYVGSYILSLIFEDPMSPEYTAKQLTREQRMGLEAISNSKHFWDGFSDNCIDSRVAGVMKGFGLPIRPEDLTKFLSDKIKMQDIISQDSIYSHIFF
jgi:hypothetical protein